MNKEYKALFAPVRIGPVALKNRIAMAPMGIEYMTNPDGSLNSRVVDYYLERVRNEIGLIICSVFKVENCIEHLEECSPMITETSMNALGELCSAAHSFGSRVFVQLTAGFGRVSPPETLRGDCVSSSATPNFWDPSIICRPLEADEIRTIARRTGETASLLVRAGVDGIELHGHEGYLFDQFTTALWNKREDEYGGSLENRMRFPVECLNAIRENTGKKLAVVYRFGLKHYLKADGSAALPGEDYVEAGRNETEGLEMATALESAGFDALHVDAGCYESHYWPHPPIYQEHGCMLDMAGSARKAVNIPVIGVGRLDVPGVAAAAVEDGLIDIAAIGRGLLADPAWAFRLRFESVDDIRPCIGCYDGCLEAYSSFRHPSCAVNPSSGRERLNRLSPAAEPLSVAVAGGGIAGMEAARLAALRGHRVSLFEKSGVLGGTVNLAAVPDFKKDLRRLMEWYKRQLYKCGAVVSLNHAAAAEEITGGKYDVFIAATGAEPLVPSIQGINSESVVTAVDVLAGKRTPGKRPVVVGGGLAGCELAIWLAQKGLSPTVIEALDDICSGAPVPMQVKMMTRDLLRKYKINVITSCRAQKITDGSIEVGSAPAAGGKETVKAVTMLETDRVILAAGMTPLQALSDEVEKSGMRVYRVGDCRAAGNIMNAVRDSYEIAGWI